MERGGILASRGVELRAARPAERVVGLDEPTPASLAHAFLRARSAVLTTEARASMDAQSEQMDLR